MNQDKEISLKSIGIINNDRNEIMDDNWQNVISTIQLSDAIFEPSATAELDQFSHIEVIFYMDKVSEQKIVAGARHPRNDINLPKVGILAQRGKNRPNRIGVSFANLIDVDGLTLTVSGLDAINATPVLDIKPCMDYFLPRTSITQPKWVDEIMKNYY